MQRSTTGCMRGTTPVDYSHAGPGRGVRRTRRQRNWRSSVSATAGGEPTQAGTVSPATRLGLAPGMVIQELGWDSDTDDALRMAVEDTNDGDMVDAVLLWWRSEDGDLVDGLVDALTDLVGGGAIWLLTPKVGRPNAVEPADIAEAAPIAGLSQT